MEPRIQYAKTSDGVSIAYWSMGEGLPFVHLSPGYPFSHLKAEWDIPGWLAWCQQLASYVKLVRLDPRGCGLSDRDVADRSVDKLVLDIEAVVDELALPQFAVAGVHHSGPAAIAYAAAHPDRVARLILWCSYSRSDEARSPQANAMHTLLRSDWEVYTETAAHILFGWSEAEARPFAAFMRESATQAEAWAAFDSIDRVDVTKLLSEIRCPTLVVHPRGFPVFNTAPATRMAARIPRSRLVILDGSSLAPWRLDDPAMAMSTVAEFLAEGEPTAALPDLPSGTAIILFADIVDSTALTERLGDDAFREKARDLDGALRAVIREHSGTPIDGRLLGDGVLATFASARQAIEAALACGKAGDDGGLPLHLGLHAGDVIREENNVYGGAVNIAARISALSAPGELLVSDTLRGLARTSAGVRFENRGERELRGVSEPVRVYEVRWGE